jgi:hypothetical protein
MLLLLPAMFPQPHVMPCLTVSSWYFSQHQYMSLQDGSKPAPIELKFSPEVQQALQQNRPVVALESTVISHGELTAAGNISTPFMHTCVNHSMQWDCFGTVLAVPGAMLTRYACAGVNKATARLRAQPQSQVCQQCHFHM